MQRPCYFLNAGMLEALTQFGFFPANLVLDPLFPGGSVAGGKQQIKLEFGEMLFFFFPPSCN